MISSQNLLEIECRIVSKHLMDDSDDLAGTVPKGIVVSPAFSDLFIVVQFKGRIVFNNIMSCFYQRIL